MGNKKTHGIPLLDTQHHLAYTLIHCGRGLHLYGGVAVFKGGVSVDIGARHSPFFCLCIHPLWEGLSLYWGVRSSQRRGECKSWNEILSPFYAYASIHCERGLRLYWGVRSSQRRGECESWNEILSPFYAYASIHCERGLRLYWGVRSSQRRGECKSWNEILSPFFAYASIHCGRA